MTHYHFISPVLKRSTKEIRILDENNIEVGSIQRYFNSKFSYFLDIFLSNFIVNVKAHDKTKMIVAKVEENVKWKDFIKFVRLNWNVTNELGTFKMIDRTKIKTHPEYELLINDLSYKINKDLGNKTIKIHNDAAQLVATIQYDKMIPPQRYTINIINPEVSIHTVACLSYVFILRN